MNIKLIEKFSYKIVTYIQNINKIKKYGKIKYYMNS